MHAVQIICVKPLYTHPSVSAKKKAIILGLTSPSFLHKHNFFTLLFLVIRHLQYFIYNRKKSDILLVFQNHLRSHFLSSLALTLSCMKKHQHDWSSGIHLHVVKTSSSANVLSNCQSFKKKKTVKRSAKLTTSALLSNLV